MKIRFIILCLFLIAFLIPQTNSLKIPDSKKKILNQAYSLKKNGLIDEALKIYNNLFLEHPQLYEVYEPIKLILINRKDLDYLNQITNKYTEANNNNLQAMINVFDVYIMLEQEKKINLVLSQLIEEFPNNKKSIKKIFKILLNKNKIGDVVNTLSQMREKEIDFYALELGMHYSMIMMIEKSLDEFFIFLNNNPKQKDFIFNRILALPDLDFVMNKTKNYLMESNSNYASLLLSKIEFKQKNYLKSYELISSYQNNGDYYVNFIEDLIKVKEFELAQKVIKDVFESNADKKIMEKTIFLLAQIFEKLLINENYGLFLINDIKKNEILNSPFKKINDDKSMLLNKAITIYDSLRINTNQVKPLYHLAEINYKILGDYDGANTLYNQVLTMGYNNYYKKSIERIIDIMISKGDLEQALSFIEKNKKITQKNDMHDLLEIKKIQILYYLNDLEKLNNNISEITKRNLKNHSYYNDILKISYDVMLFSDDSNFKKYSLAMHKIYQNKRPEAISILETMINIDNELIADKIRFDCAYLYFSQGDNDRAIELIKAINDNSPFKEQAILFEAEIFDYILKNKSKAAELYLLFLDDFKLSIYYESVRFRLRELAG